MKTCKCLENDYFGDLYCGKVYSPNPSWLSQSQVKKSRIRETKNLSTDADSKTDTILERLHNLSKKKEKKVVV